ncbi:MAG: hypothetical protein R3C19_12185 [Planctomycetaceae bacterium]
MTTAKKFVDELVAAVWWPYGNEVVTMRMAKGPNAFAVVSPTFTSCFLQRADPFAGEIRLFFNNLVK